MGIFAFFGGFSLFFLGFSRFLWGFLGFFAFFVGFSRGICPVHQNRAPFHATGGLNDPPFRLSILGQRFMCRNSYRGRRIWSWQDARAGSGDSARKTVPSAMSTDTRCDRRKAS